MKDGDLPLPNVALMLGAEIVGVDADAGAVAMAYNGKPEFANPAGNIQGGMLTAMLDDAMALALLATLGENEFAPTLELKVNFIAPANVGRLGGRGKVVSKGNSVCVLAGELRQDDKLIATSTATALIVKNRI